MLVYRFQLFLFLLTAVTGFKEARRPPPPQITSKINVKNTSSIEIKWEEYYNPSIIGYKIRLYEILPLRLFKIKSVSGIDTTVIEWKPIPVQMNSRLNPKKKVADLDIPGVHNTTGRFDDLKINTVYEYTVVAYTKESIGYFTSPMRFKIISGDNVLTYDMSKGRIFR